MPLRTIPARAAAMLLLLAGAGPVVAQAKKEKAQFAGLTVQLLYLGSGEFSPPVSQIKKFSTWNFTVFGEGVPSDSRFSSVLIKLAFKAKGEVFAAGLQAVMTVQERGEKKARRYVFRDVYLGRSGRGYHAVLVREIGCLPLDITVRSHGREVKRSISFRCGE